MDGLMDGQTDGRIDGRMDGMEGMEGAATPTPHAQFSYVNLA